MASPINHQDSPSPSDSNNLICPVCYNLLLAPIYQCNKGHLVCNVCVKKLRLCAGCQVALPEDKIRNLVAEDIVAKSIMKCPNRAHGCRIICKGVQMLKHLRDCECRLVQVCPALGFPRCVLDFPVKHAVSHLQTVHNMASVSILEGQYVRMNQCGLQGDETGPCATEWPPVLLLSEKYPPLILKTAMVADSLQWAISALHSHEKVGKLTAKIKLLFHPEEEINSVTWKCRVSELKNSFDRRPFSVLISNMRGLKDWKVLVKISSETNRENEARPEPNSAQGQIPGAGLLLWN